MDDSMLGRFVRGVVTVPSEMLGTLCDLIEKIISDRAWYEELKRFLRKESTWVKTSSTHPDGRYVNCQVWVEYTPEELRRREEQDVQRLLAHLGRRGVKMGGKSSG